MQCISYNKTENPVKIFGKRPGWFVPFRSPARTRRPKARERGMKQQPPSAAEGTAAALGTTTLVAMLEHNYSHARALNFPCWVNCYVAS